MQILGILVACFIIGVLVEIFCWRVVDSEIHIVSTVVAVILGLLKGVIGGIVIAIISVLCWLFM